MPKIVIATGGRDYENYRVVRDGIAESGATLLIEGGAKGADTLARRAADELGIEHITYWALWRRYGNPAGMRRNHMMLRLAQRLSENVEVRAFPGGSGTAGMKSISRQSGLVVVEHA